jgi:riboflavin kinase/FMN adenylyltransferase
VNILHAIEGLAGLKGSIVLAAGTFDGVHLGHQALIRRAMEEAASYGGTAVVMTFDRHPASLLRPELAPKLLTRNAEKISLIEELGVSALLLLPFTSELAAVSAQDFIKELVASCQPLRAICVGSQWSYGRGGEGNIARLREFGSEWNFDVIQIDPVETTGTPISSTRVRTAIASGDLDQASTCLGRPFILSGEVVVGAGLGAKIGFPTANLDVAGMQLPPNGVYTVKVRHGESILSGVCNIGLRPTVDASATLPVVEVHLFDFSADLVGAELSLEFVQFLRPELKFNGLEELKEQIACDCTQARAILEQTGGALLG